MWVIVVISKSRDQFVNRKVIYILRSHCNDNDLLKVSQFCHHLLLSIKKVQLFPPRVGPTYWLLVIILFVVASSCRICLGRYHYSVNYCTMKHEFYLVWHHSFVWKICNYLPQQPETQKAPSHQSKDDKMDSSTLDMSIHSFKDINKALQTAKSNKVFEVFYSFKAYLIEIYF